jgi:hypothetical protein
MIVKSILHSFTSAADFAQEICRYSSTANVENWEQTCFFKDLLQRAYLACSRTRNKIVPLTNLNKYLYNGKSELKENINNNNSEKF